MEDVIPSDGFSDVSNSGSALVYSVVEEPLFRVGVLSLAEFWEEEVCHCDRGAEAGNF